MNNNSRFIFLILLLALIGFSTVFVEVAAAVGSADAHTPAEVAQTNFNTLNTESQRQENLLSDRKLELSNLKQDESTVSRWISGTASDQTDALALSVASACDLSGFSSGASTAVAARKAIEAANLDRELAEIRQGIYDKETDIISQTDATQTAITNRNNALKTWDQALGPNESPTVDGVAILPLAVPPDYVRTVATRPVLDPLVYCRGGCGREVGLMSYGIPNDWADKKRCELPVERAFWNLYSGKCTGLYFNCNGQTSADCPHVDKHLSNSGSTPPSGGSQPPSGSTPPSTSPSEPTDNTPNCQDCTSHCSSPCSCTNSGTCGGTVVDNTPNCSGCTSHCSSPCSCSDSGTCNGTVAAPTPDPPTTVSCGRSGCTASVSSSEEHRLGPCGESTCGATGWSCAGYTNWWNNQHKLRTCRRSQCGQSWRNCSGGKPATCRANANWRCQAQ